MSAIPEDHVKEVSSLVRKERRGKETRMKCDMFFRCSSSLFIKCDPCWQNESECARANFELQTKKVKNVDFGCGSDLFTATLNISVVNCTLYVCVLYCIIFNTYQNAPYRVQNTLLQNTEYSHIAQCLIFIVFYFIF